MEKPGTSIDVGTGPVEARVVAGWSGSEVSDRALAIAVGFAERHALPLHVVLAWDLLDQPGEDWDPEITEDRVRAQLDAAIAPVRVGHPDVEVTGETQHGWPPTVVADAAQGATVLVVGRSMKTHGFFGDWSPDALVRRVHCPIVWVP